MYGIQSSGPVTHSPPVVSGMASESPNLPAQSSARYKYSLVVRRIVRALGNGRSIGRPRSYNQRLGALLTAGYEESQIAGPPEAYLSNRSLNNRPRSKQSCSSSVRGRESKSNSCLATIHEQILHLPARPLPWSPVSIRHCECYFNNYPNS